MQSVMPHGDVEGTNYAGIQIHEERRRGEATLEAVARGLAIGRPAIKVHPVLEPVRRVIQYVLTNHHDLLDYRNLDQVVLVAIYGVCKIYQMDVTFKDLVQAYKALAGVNPSTWLEVPLARPGSFGNIIAFYNDVFVPRCKDYLHGMKDATSLLMGTPRSAAAPEPQAAPNTGMTASTLTGSPGGFRATKRARVSAGLKSEGTDVKGEQDEPAGVPTEAPASPERVLGSMLPPPLSPTRRPVTHVPRSPYAEYPASPFKGRALASPMRPGASPIRASSAMRHAQQVPAKYGQVSLSPARKQIKSPLQAQTPRTAFLHAFGSLGATSPALRFEGINDKLKSPQQSPVLQRKKMATKPLDFDRRRAAGPSGLCVAGSGLCGEGAARASSDGAAHATMSAQSGLLALAQASDTAPQAPASAPETAPLPTHYTQQRMQDLAVASVIVADGEAQQGAG